MSDRTDWADRADRADFLPFPPLTRNKGTQITLCIDPMAALIYRSWSVDSVGEKQALGTFYVEIIQKIIQPRRTRARTRKLGGKICFLCERMHNAHSRLQRETKNSQSFPNISRKLGNISLGIHLARPKTFAILLY